MLEIPRDIKDQIGSGSLIIDLEVETREETGWAEEVILPPTFTLHTTKKNWSEAESFCQSEGGHLASVTSYEENQMVTDIAAGKAVWLGGRKKRMNCGFRQIVHL